MTAYRDVTYGYEVFAVSSHVRCRRARAIGEDRIAGACFGRRVYEHRRCGRRVRGQESGW